MSGDGVRSLKFSHVNHEAQMPCRPHRVAASPFIQIYDTLDIIARARSLRSRHTLANLTHGSSLLMLYVQC